MTFDAVIQGILRYLDDEIYPGMSDWQDVLARIAVSRLLNNKEQLKETLTANTFIQTFGIMTHDGLVDVDGLIRDLKQQINRKGKLEITIPMFGKFTFSETDVDRLSEHIKRGG